MLDNIIMDIDDIPLTENDKSMIKHETSEEDLVSFSVETLQPAQNSFLNYFFFNLISTGRHFIVTNK